MVGQLKSFSVSNFGPFAEEILFYTTANLSQKELLNENTFEIGDDRYNRVSYIFGANGAGKSTFCKAILQFQTILAMSPIYASNNPQVLEIAPFKGKFQKIDTFIFDKKYEEKPTVFKIEIIIDKMLYAYSYAVQGEKIIFERLTKKYRRTEIIMDRPSPDYSSIILKSELKDFENNISVVKDNALCLSMAAFLNNELANKLNAAIMSIHVINMAQYRNLSNINEKTCSQERIEQYLNVLKFADPTLKKIQVSFNEKQVERQSMSGPDFENRELVVKSVEIDVTSFHRMYQDDIEIESEGLPFLQFESTGTIKLFGVLPVIFDVLENGGTVLVDEIENGLHPNIVNQLVKLFQNEATNPYNAQLICTTHCLPLIDKGVRRDQVWTVRKNERGISKIDCISEMQGMRAYENNGQKYLAEAFGDIPVSIFIKQ